MTVYQGTRGAGVGTGAAADARTGLQCGAIGSEKDPVPTVPDLPDLPTFDLVTDPDAPEAQDAPGQVHVEVGVAEIHEWRFAGLRRMRGNFRAKTDWYLVTEKLLDERCGMDPGIRISRVPFSEKAEECPADRFNVGRLGLDDHPFRQGSCAGGYQPIGALDLHRAEAARTGGLEAVIVTQGGNVDGHPTTGLEE